jgi:spheroidene monooxygenase
MPLPVTCRPPADGPVAALTRASIRPLSAWPFWQHAPPAEIALNQASGCRLAAGLGEAPVWRQATFTLWDQVESMDRYARGGAHLAAIQAARAHGYFSESMFVRFVPSAAMGRWKGQDFG